jgi:hypothetical protein
MSDVLRHQGPAAVVSEQCGQQYGDEHCHAITQYTVQIFLSVCSKSPVLACHTASHCNVHSLLSHPTPDNPQGLVLKNP